MHDTHTSPVLAALTLLGAAVICVPVFAALRLGSVLGYLVAGCLIGPHVLALVEDVHALMQVAELGVVLMLFVIGLELDPARLWQLRKGVFGGGFLQLGLCTALLVPVGLGAGFGAGAALVAALALSLSSTAIAMQSMAERNLVNAPVGRNIFGILLFQDLAAIPIMSVVPLLAPARTASSDASGLWKAALAVLLVVGIGRYALGPILRVIARTGMREVFTAFALCVVLGIAELMSLAGLSMALGSFLAGVLLAGSEYRRALETDLEPFKGLLLGLFFMSVGMTVDLGLLRDELPRVLALLAAFQLLKGAALWLTGRLLGVARFDLRLFTALLVQGGEFAFVVLGVAREAGVLPGNGDALLTLAVALSMALTPLFLLLHDKLSARDAQRDARTFDTMEDEGARVIIAGFGRFGQIVGRLLFASGIRVTVLDHDPDQIELMRRFGFRVFYGDATRLDLLSAAGADKAELVVNAIDDVDDNLELVDVIREHFPKARIVCRARNVTHYVQLRARNVAVVERETFEAALAVGLRALTELGVRPYEARERVARFRRHNVAMLDALVPHFHDEARRMSVAKAGREELERLFERDRASLDAEGAAAFERPDEAAHEA
jgi:glutathione-regulated potassium-efflux system ancillary protein KefC